MSHTDPVKTPVASGRSLPLRDWTAWRDLLLRAGVGLLTIFVGVTAAFFFDGYREQLERDQKLKDARQGIIAELKTLELGGAEVVDDIDKSLASWKQANAAGTQAVPGYYVMTGSPRPPTAAWTSAVASGVAGILIRIRSLGWVTSTPSISEFMTPTCAGLSLPSRKYCLGR